MVHLDFLFFLPPALNVHGNCEIVHLRLISSIGNVIKCNIRQRECTRSNFFFIISDYNLFVIPRHQFLFPVAVAVAVVFNSVTRRREKLLKHRHLLKYYGDEKTKRRESQKKISI